jgi:hypothetical protein
VPRVLYFCREHPGRASHGSRRAKAAALEPARANRFRHPMLGMYVEYVFDFARAVWTSPLSWRDRFGCTWEVAGWALGAVTAGMRRSSASSTTG